MQVYTYVWFWVVCGYMYAYVCVHLGIMIYLLRDHKFSPASIKCRCQIKVDQRPLLLGSQENGCLPMCLCLVLGGKGSRNRSVLSWYIIRRVNMLLEGIRGRHRRYTDVEIQLENCQKNRVSLLQEVWEDRHRRDLEAQVVGTTDTELGWENRYRRDRLHIREWRTESGWC